MDAADSSDGLRPARGEIKGFAAAPGVWSDIIARIPIAPRARMAGLSPTLIVQRRCSLVRTMLFKGVFWFIRGDEGSEMLYCVKVPCNSNGETAKRGEFGVGSGIFNHKAQWARLDVALTGGHTYNYYPRGSVKIKNGVATVRLAPCLNTSKSIDKILLYFGLFEENGLTDIRIKRNC